METRVKINDSVLDEYLQCLKERFGPGLLKVVLYGSRARGDYQKASDYDLIIILDKITKDTYDKLDEISGEFLYKYGVVFSAIVVTDEEYKKQTYNPLFMNIRKEGITL